MAQHTPASAGASQEWRNRIPSQKEIVGLPTGGILRSDEEKKGMGLGSVCASNSRAHGVVGWNSDLSLILRCLGFLS